MSKKPSIIKPSSYETDDKIIKINKSFSFEKEDLNYKGLLRALGISQKAKTSDKYMGVGENSLLFQNSTKDVEGVRIRMTRAMVLDEKDEGGLELTIYDTVTQTKHNFTSASLTSNFEKLYKIDIAISDDGQKLKGRVTYLGGKFSAGYPKKIGSKSEMYAFMK